MVIEGILDSGAAMLVLPQTVVKQLGLLRGNALAAAVAFDRIGAVEEREEFDFLFLRRAEIQAAAWCRQTLIRVKLWPAASQVERAGHPERCIANNLGFHAAGIEAPVMEVFRID